MKKTKQQRKDNRKQVFNKVKKTVKTKSQNVKSNVKTVAKKAGQKVGKVSELVLRPYLSVMKKALGYQSNEKISIEELAREFYNRFVKNSQNDVASYYDPYNPDNNVIGKSYSDLNEFDNFIDPVSLSAIFSGIVAYFKGLKEKKAEGQPLTSGQKTVLDAAEKANVRLDEIKETEKNTYIGESVSNILDSPIAKVVGLVLLLAISFGIYKAVK